MVAVVTLVLIIVAVAFFTLLERRVLGGIHLRMGPNKPGLGGLVVPFADAVKLFLKEISSPTLRNKGLFNMIALAIIGVPMVLWYVFPHCAPALDPKVICVYVIAIARISVYGTIGAGWSSNRKYRLLGALRAVAQTIRYEVRITLIILSAVVFFYYDMTQEKQMGA